MPGHAQAGAAPVTTPPGEIIQNLLTGAIDAAEWIGPWNDHAFQAAEGGEVLRAGLPRAWPRTRGDGQQGRLRPAHHDLKAIVEAAALAATSETYADFVYHNIEAFEPLVAQDKVELRTFPDEVVRAMGRAAMEVLDELGASNEMAKRAYDSFRSFLAKADAYGQRSDLRLLEMRRLVLQG